MIILDTTSKKIVATTSGTSSTDVVASFVDLTATGWAGGSTDQNIASATTVDVVVAPGASTSRKVTYLSFANKGTSSQLVIVSMNVSGTLRQLTSATLQRGETLLFVDGRGWEVRDRGFREKVSTPEYELIGGNVLPVMKATAASEGAGLWYSTSKDAGTPGAWAVGTPGVTGRATDGTDAADAGCIRLPNAASGNNYLVGFSAGSTILAEPHLVDVLWVNSGLVVTTTTAQAVNSVAFPARDRDGTANGIGCWVGILVVTATTNAGAVTNTTLDYTNSSGVAGRTATMASFPATAVAGNVTWFQLQAGDEGVQSIQNITLGTSYAAGAISLIVARPLASAPISVINTGSKGDTGRGTILYSGVCLQLFEIQTATTLHTVTAKVFVEAR